jgi:hypothetical protein
MAMNPRFPIISLGDAISRAKTIYEREHLSTLAPAAMAEAMGYKGLNGASLRMIGALRQYGLIEGRGEGAKISKDAQTLIIDDPTSPDYVAAIRRIALNPQVFLDIRKQFPGQASERNIAISLEKKGFKPDAAAEAAKNFKETMALVPAESEGYNSEESVDAPASGDGMQTHVSTAPRPAMRPPASEPALQPGAPLRVVMNGDRLDIQASVDLAGLKKLKEMLTKFEGILEMMAPEVSHELSPPPGDAAYRAAQATGIKPAQMPFMITQAQKQQLGDLGYSEDAIRNMTPQQSLDVLAAGLPPLPYSK